MPVVDRTPTGDDLLSEWAPRTGRDRGRHRTVEAESVAEPRPASSPAGGGRGAPALRLVPARAGGRSDDGWSAGNRDDAGSIDDRPDDDWPGDDWPGDKGWVSARAPERAPTPGPDQPTASAGADPAAPRPDDPDSDTVETESDADPDAADADPEAADADPEAADADPEAAAAEPVRVRRQRINGRWGRFAELWVPESMREARVDPGRRGMLVLMLVAAVAAVVAAVGVWRDRPEPRPIETAVVTAASVPPAAPVSEAAASPAAAVGDAGTSGVAPSPGPAGPPETEILVSVTGLVANPGVVRLNPDARVADAIAAAGGTQPGADLTGMNLAAKLADGDSVVVTDTGAGDSTGGTGSVGAGGSTGGADATPAGGLVNLNTADEAALDTLPGVGPVMAQNILAWRETNGKFSSIEQLQEISGIGPSRYAQLAPLVTVG